MTNNKDIKWFFSSNKSIFKTQMAKENGGSKNNAGQVCVN